MKKYGLPYMGSKSSLAEWILSYLPPAKNLYDLFCGGCAITHCAIVQERFQNYYINDIIEGMPQGFVDCIKGKYRNDYRWISHEEFDVLKGQGDLLVDLCFSYGNNNKKGYAYSSKVEPLKKGLHYAICFDDHTLLQNLGIDLSTVLSDGGTMPERRLRVRRHFSQSLESLERLERLQRLQSLESLERLERLQSLQSLERPWNIILSSRSYDEIEIKPDSIIYCDPPYRGKATYNACKFDYEAFYDWCRKQSNPLFISLPEMPDDFICVASKEKAYGLGAHNNTRGTERLFIPKHQSGVG